MDWVGLGWVGLGWVGLDWIGLDWVGLGWVGLGFFQYLSRFITYPPLSVFPSQSNISDDKDEILQLQNRAPSTFTQRNRENAYFSKLSPHGNILVINP